MTLVTALRIGGVNLTFENQALVDELCRPFQPKKLNRRTRRRGGNDLAGFCLAVKGEHSHGPDLQCIYRAAFRLGPGSFHWFVAFRNGVRCLYVLKPTSSVRTTFGLRSP